MKIICTILMATFALSAEDKNPDQDLNLRAYIELLRSDLKTQRVAVITSVMNLSDEEGAKFWPIYRQYEAEMAQLGDRRMALMQDYCANYENLTDQKANELGDAVFDLEMKRTDLKKKYFKKLGQAMSGRTAARFFQVENQILMLLDLQLASILPAVK